jgi:SPP1 gp7 family putative phage head morphogenesis protein
MARLDESQEAAQQKVYDAILRHALAIERNNNGIVADMNKVVDDAAKGLSAELLDRLENLTPGELQLLSRHQLGRRIDRLPTRVQGVIKLVDEWARKLGEAVSSTWQSEATEFAQAEADFTREMMGAVLAETVVANVSAESIYKAAMEQPVLGTFVEQALSQVSDNTRERVYARVREGVSTGQTNAEIIRSLRGTATTRYRDGILQGTRNDLARITRTGRSHLSNVAYNETYKALGVEEVVFIATIDGRTTLRCSSLDQSTYAADSNYPRPPLHWQCRSVTAPYFGGKINGNRPFVKAFRPVGQIPKSKRPDSMIGQVKASTSMAEFLKRPDNAAFARQYFGETRFRLFKEGKLSIKQMIRADGSRMSIAELRAKYRQDFKEVFGE